MTDIISSTSRRQFALSAMGVLTALALTACGGGGSDDSPKVNLRTAFDKIQYRMTKEEVRAIVGRREDDESSTSWVEGDEMLLVTFTANDQQVFIAVRVRWYSGSKVLDRSLNQGE